MRYVTTLLALLAACCSPPAATSPGSVGQGPLVDALRSDCTSFLLARIRDKNDLKLLAEGAAGFESVEALSKWGHEHLSVQVNFGSLRYRGIFDRQHVPIDEKQVLKILGEVAGELK